MPVPDLLCEPSQGDFWMGPGGNLVKLIVPDEYYTNTLDTATVVHALLGGGNSSQRVSKTRRHYGTTFTARAPEEADQILAIFAGQMGPSPYYFVDPLWRNVLGTALSNANARLRNTAGFIPTGSTVAYDATTFPPIAPVLSGIVPGCIAWTAASGSTLAIGATSGNVLDPTTAVPIIPSLPMTAFCELRTASSTASVSVQLYFNDINGAFLSATTLTTVTATTTWTRFAGTLAAFTAPAAAVTCGIRLLCNTSTPPIIYTTKHGLSYYTASVAGVGGSLLQAWVNGFEVPHVMVASGSPSNHSKAARRRTMALDLVEA